MEEIETIHGTILSSPNQDKSKCWIVDILELMKCFVCCRHRGWSRINRIKLQKKLTAQTSNTYFFRDNQLFPVKLFIIISNLGWTHNNVKESVISLCCNPKHRASCLLKILYVWYTCVMRSYSLLKRPFYFEILKLPLSEEAFLLFLLGLKDELELLNDETKKNAILVRTKLKCKWSSSHLFD